MAQTIGFTGGTGSTSSININGSPVLTLDASGNLGGVASLNGTFPSGFKNKIIGGDFTTNPWQRGTSFTALANTGFAADRFSARHTGTSAVVDWLKTTDAPTATQAGVYTQHCLHLDVTTADVSIAAGDLYVVDTRVEGLNAASFGFGQSGTRYVTLSFWHKHTKTGTYCVAFQNSAANRSYIAEYTQDVTDTWEKATITTPVDTTGTWLYDSGVGLTVAFTLGAGASNQTTAGSWQAGNYYCTANQVNALDSTANNFKIALVQLEAGSVATPFETRSVGQELALCQRYYYRVSITTGKLFGTAGSSVTNSIGNCMIPFPVPMRTAPSTLEQTGTAGNYGISFANTNTPCTSVPAFSSADVIYANTQWTCTSGHTAGQVGYLYAAATSYLGWSAEL